LRKSEVQQDKSASVAGEITPQTSKSDNVEVLPDHRVQAEKANNGINEGQAVAGWNSKFARQSISASKSFAFQIGNRAKKLINQTDGKESTPLEQKGVDEEFGVQDSDDEKMTSNRLIFDVDGEREGPA
jgi:hypothetical protein